MSEVVMGPGEYQRDEYPASAAVEPGELVEQSGGEVAPHATADGAAESAFALEDRDMGRTIDDTYAAGENVHVGYPANGTLIPNAWLAAAENVTAGTRLVSAGNGALAAYDDVNSPEAQVVAVAEEAVDNSGGGSAVRIEVRSA